MDDHYPRPDWHEIIAQLRLEASRIMEDTADSLASTLPTDHATAGLLLSETRQAADDIQSLLAAAQVLHRRCLGTGDQD